jgi:hypothetical protein
MAECDAQWWVGAAMFVVALGFFAPIIAGSIAVVILAARSDDEEGDG